MKLTMYERLALLNVLPGQGNFVELTIIGNLRTRLLPSEQEIEDFEIVVDGALTIVKKPADETIVDIEVSDRAREVVTRALKERDTGGTLTLPDVPLYEKFVGMPELPDGELTNGESATAEAERLTQEHA